MAAVLAHMVKEARARDLEVGVVYLPSRLQYDPRAHERSNPTVAVGVRVRRAWLTEPAEIELRLARWAENLEVPFLDLTPAFRQAAASEPDETAVLSSRIEEPEMPEWFLTSAGQLTPRYMSTFRGCASLARADRLQACGFYDEELFIFGNERDLTCRLLGAGYRVLQYPEVHAFHKTPFGIQMGKRSLYYHARNAWLSMLKYAPMSDLVRMPWLVVSRVLLRGGGKEAAGEVTDATGTIGIGRSIRETPGATWILARAALSILYNLPYCMRHREPVTAEDFELPLG